MPENHVAAEIKSKQPTFAAMFRCIGPQCEDTCCGAWDIPLDKITYLKYRTFPADALGSLVSHFVTVSSREPREKWYGTINRRADGFCPFYGEDRLCSIQTQYGPESLSSTCSLYPRSLAAVHGVLEGALSLSCPEAARQVLLEEHSTEQVGDLLSGQFRTDNVFGLRNNNDLGAIYLLVRDVVVDLIRDRSRPLWQRLLMIVALCVRLDKVRPHDLGAAGALLSRYRKSLGQGSSLELDRAMPDVARRIELTLFLSNQRCQDEDCSRRFRDVFWDFIEAIGSATSEGEGEDVGRFRNSSREHLEPLLEKMPFILENYVLNHIYQHLFPFGRTGSDRFAEHTMAEEAVLLIVRYSWVTTLLTGVAARHGPCFEQAHVVSTIQTFTRAIEHAPYILEDALAFVQSRDLDTMAGLAKLLRS